MQEKGRNFDKLKDMSARMGCAYVCASAGLSTGWSVHLSVRVNICLPLCASISYQAPLCALSFGLMS